MVYLVLGFRGERSRARFGRLISEAERQGQKWPSLLVESGYKRTIVQTLKF